MEIEVKISKAQPVGTLIKALRILDLISESPRGLRLKEVSQHSGFNKSTAYRFLSHLERDGYLVRNSSQCYVLGIKFIEMAARGNWVEGLRSIAWPYLRDLQRSTNESVNVGIRDADAVLYVEVLESPHAFRLVSSPGTKRPLHSTALGKALLAFLPAEQQERLLAGLRFQKMTPRTITTAARLRKELALTRKRGFAVDDEEAITGARCIAAPVLDSRQRAIAAISLTAPVSRVARRRLPSLAKSVQATAAHISKAYRHPLAKSSSRRRSTR